ncbi:UDP-3-O-(3-hydroxymyristoyl)glucosamine N-acyltransferase [Silvibacterium dinghuense]|uniref:UDP-3-O-acylglucosamine N-acyltransferase n=1 Tax=Silvibacterium dinghuense TaxID=1560006 RepID=A0A4Q1SD01_9BACT|nr:UDP-3-O-(3-hydroxymyristoyl)glucosamine N-acyltransferase [Silvibacterium dinghuense]RXS94973.1 UDP-3-O-(3-hydroxymyristoyl)glucosamine N-acyltransferase [Silvibacterium dinghuense]GGH09498.1 UDP-3-O-acylglucosamine N-acyltransferase [Silvibacterium dinghuense]
MTRLVQLAEVLKTELRFAEGREELHISGVAGAKRAGASDLVFAEDAEALEAALASAALAVIVARKIAPEENPGKTLLVTPQPKLAFAQAARLLRVQDEAAGIHPTAVIAPDVVLGRRVSIGAYAVLEAGVKVGDDSRVDAGAVLGAGVKVGQGCRIYPRVVVYPGVEMGDRVVIHAGAVLGGDGFGYVRDRETGAYTQFPQQGRLVIEDDVEIGANTTVDRGALEETRLEKGVKIDNLVHIGHNVRVGKHVVIAAQTGISGSSEIGNHAIVGGQVGIGDHATVGEQVILGSGSGVLTHKKVKGAGVVFWGRPARPLKQYLKELATLAKLSRG